MTWQASWTQAMVNVGATARTFENVTLRSRFTPTIGGDQVRLELNNQFGTEPVSIGHLAFTVGGLTADARFDGNLAGTIAAGGSLWTDPVHLPIRRGDELDIDIYLPELTPYSTGNVMGNTFRLSVPGDFAGRADFGDSAPFMLAVADGVEIPLAAPFIRSLEVSGADAGDVIVCFGDSITVMGWPGITATLLPAEPAIAIVNRGLAGNRLRFDPGAPQLAAFGPSGLSRFDSDVLGTAGVTRVIVALGINDILHPGTVAPIEQLTTSAELIAAYGELVDRATTAGLGITFVTITPFAGATGADTGRELVRTEVNEWIRASAPSFVDFDAAIRSTDAPVELIPEYDMGDHLHPSPAGQAKLAETMAAALTK